MILALKTDQPEAYVALLDTSGVVKAEKKWLAGKQLSDTLLLTIEELLKECSLEYSDIDGVVLFKGPGSFTGLRIGFTVGNTIAYANACSVVSSLGDDWIDTGVASLANGENEKIATPEYGGEANVTIPRK